MTVSTDNIVTTHVCNGATVAFATGFPFLENEHLAVTRVEIATGVRAQLALGTHYTVSGASASAGGTVTTVGAPLSALYELEIRRATEIVQPADYVANDGADAETMEDGFDRLTMICQEMQAVIVEIIDIVGGGGSGRATVTNIAGPGIGWFSQQVGADFQFKKLNPVGDFAHYPTGEAGLRYTDSMSVATLAVGGPHRMLTAEFNPTDVYRVRFDEVGQYVIWTTGTDPDLKHWGWAAAGDGGLALQPLQDNFEALGSTFLWLHRDALGEFTGMDLVGVPLTITDAALTFVGGPAAKLDMGGHDIVNIGAIAFSSLALTGTLSVAGLITANGGINVNNSTGILLTGASITFAGAASGKLDMGGHDIINIGAIGFSSLALTGTLSVAGATTLSTVSASGLISANAGVTVAGGPLTMNGQSIVFTGALTGKLDMGGHDIINIGAFALTSLSLSGTLGVTGAATFGSTVTATGLVSANGGLAVTGTSSHSGAATFGSTLAATGLVSANGGLAVTGNASVSGTATLGAASVTGTLGVTGATTVSTLAASGLVSANAGLAVTGAASVSGTATLGAATITGAATVGGTLGVTGATTVSTLTASGLITANLGLTVNGAALTMNSQPITFAGTSAAKLDMGGHDIINVGAFALSSLTLSGALTVGGLVTANAGLAVTGAATFSSTASFGGLVSANAGLAVTGNASVSGTATLGAASITGTSSHGGAATFTTTASFGGLVSANAGLAVTGAASVSGTATMNAAVITTTASVGGLLTASAGLSTTTIAASGLVSANAGLAVTGAASVSGTATLGAASITGTSSHGGAATFASTASFTGLVSANGGLSTTTIAASGLISANAGITVTGTASVSSTMTVAGLLTLSNGLDVTGDVAVSGELDVQGEIFGRAGAQFEVGPVVITDGSLHLLGTGVYLNLASNRIIDAGVISLKETAKGTTGGAVTFDFSGTGVASYNITLNAASTWTFTAPTFGGATTYIECTQDGTGSRVVTLPAVCKFTAGTAAADKLASTGAGKRDLYVFRWNQTATACLTQIFKDW
jgi:hypothetical protein